MIRGGLRLVVFDFDGTLIDSLATIHGAMSGAAVRLGFDPPQRDRVRDVIGLPLREAVGAVFADAPAEHWDPLATAYKEAFVELTATGTHTERLFPGAVECLEVLEADGFLLGIATGKGRRGLDRALEAHGLADRFATLQTSDQGPGKPHPDMLHRAMVQVGVDAVDTVMIGDTWFDMAMAKSADVTAIGAAWGYHTVADLVSAGADHIATRFEDLQPLVHEILVRGDNTQ